jgi:hypothetical protein
MKKIKLTKEHTKNGIYYFLFEDSTCKAAFTQIKDAEEAFEKAVEAAKNPILPEIIREVEV